MLFFHPEMPFFHLEMPFFHLEMPFFHIEMPFFTSREALFAFDRPRFDPSGSERRTGFKQGKPAPDQAVQRPDDRRDDACPSDVDEGRKATQGEP